MNSNPDQYNDDPDTIADILQGRTIRIVLGTDSSEDKLYIGQEGGALTTEQAEIVKRNKQEIINSVLWLEKARETYADQPGAEVKFTYKK